jgi:hypothetical protein
MITAAIPGFYTFTVIVDGALAVDEIILEAKDVQARILDIAKEAYADGQEDGDGFDTEVYLLWHEHAPTVEDCSCVQYLTDHHPAYTFPADLCHFTTDPA